MENKTEQNENGTSREHIKTKLKGEIKSQIAEPPSQAEQVSQARATEQSE